MQDNIIDDELLAHGENLKIALQCGNVFIWKEIRAGATAIADPTMSHCRGISYNATIAAQGHSFSLEVCAANAAANPDARNKRCSAYMEAARREITAGLDAAIESVLADPLCKAFFVDAPTVSMAREFAALAEPRIPAHMAVLIILEARDDDPEYRS